MSENKQEIEELKLKEERQKRLEKALISIGITKNVKIAADTKTHHTTVSNYRTGARMLNETFALALQSAYGINSTWLLDDKGEMIISSVQRVSEANIPINTLTMFPVFGNVYCGSPASQWNVNDVIDYYQLPKLDKRKEPFGLIAKGDSMSPYINPYDMLVCVDDEKLIKRNTAVVVVFKSVETIEANAKLIKFKEKELKENKTITLYSVNTKYEPEDYSVKEILRIYKVIKIIRDVK